MEYNARIALLGNVLDYAGTFPPASLTPGDALKEAAVFRSKSKCPWLLGRIAFPVDEIKKVEPRSLYEMGADGSAWCFTALGSVSEDSDPEQFERAVEWDFREIRRCNERHYDAPVRIHTSAYETRLPVKLVQSRNPDTLFEHIAPALDRLVEMNRTHLDPYFEVTLDAKWQTTLLTVAEALGRWCEDDVDARVIPGIKVRTGGATVPTAEQLAETIVACTTRGLRFKATQGLHHAVTREGAFGFVNVFGALTLAQSLGNEAFGLEAVKRCLEESSAKAFTLDATGLGWDGKKITCEQIEAARRRHGGSFGSCSLTEPEASLLSEFPL